MRNHGSIVPLLTYADPFYSFVAALQVACFYSPLPAQRLKELAAARGLVPPALVLPNVSPSHSPSA